MLETNTIQFGKLYLIYYFYLPLLMEHGVLSSEKWAHYRNAVFQSNINVHIMVDPVSISTLIILNRELVPLGVAVQRFLNGTVWTKQTSCFFLQICLHTLKTVKHFSLHLQKILVMTPFLTLTNGQICNLETIGCVSKRKSMEFSQVEHEICILESKPSL